MSPGPLDNIRTEENNTQNACIFHFKECSHLEHSTDAGQMNSNLLCLRDDQIKFSIFVIMTSAKNNCEDGENSSRKMNNFHSLQVLLVIY